MTLLVVDLALPAVAHDAPPDELAARLWDLRPAFLSYVISFLVITSYWTSHRRIFDDIVRADAVLIWLNTLLLLCIAFQPFPTRVLGEYGDQPAAVILYAATVAMAGLMTFALWVYAARRRLLRPSVSRRVIVHRALRSLVGPLVFLSSTLIAPRTTSLAEYSWLLILPGWLILRWIYRDVI